MPPKPTPIEDRFWNCVDRSGGPDACWLWMGARDPNGYGRVSVERRCRLAHRTSFYLAHGRWPDLGCLHLCDNPPCVNPAHLVEGDQVENMRQASQRGRVASGDRHASRTKPDAFRQKLSASDVRVAMRRLRAGERCADVASDFGVTPEAISYHRRKESRRCA